MSDRSSREQLQAAAVCPPETLPGHTQVMLTNAILEDTSDKITYAVTV